MTSVMAYSHGTGIHKDDDTQKASVQCLSRLMMAGETLEELRHGLEVRSSALIVTSGSVERPEEGIELNGKVSDLRNWVTIIYQGGVAKILSHWWRDKSKSKSTYLKRTLVQFPESTQQLATTCNSYIGSCLHEVYIYIY